MYKNGAKKVLRVLFLRIGIHGFYFKQGTIAEEIQNND